MHILNADLELSDLVRIYPDLNLARLATAFRGRPIKTQFNRGDAFVRVISTEHGGEKGTGIFSSPWWQREQSFYKLLRDFRGVEPVQIMRGKLGIALTYSPRLDGLVQIVLTRRVYGWIGLAEHQEEPLTKLCYIGGAEQVLLPNLDARENFPPYVRIERALSSSFAYMRSYNWIADLSEGARA
jgi:hypothetical protein